ncbi:hypothetical protein BT69DRAFT_1351421 [Atractiella rhizophila]|nr:hypothetical protein BT69DRAFT_1351421 [Atractiella rhizophila]
MERHQHSFVTIQSSVQPPATVDVFLPSPAHAISEEEDELLSATDIEPSRPSSPVTTGLPRQTAGKKHPARPANVPENAIYVKFEGLKNGRPIFRDERGKIVDVSPRFWKGRKEAVVKENGYNQHHKRKQVKRACKGCKKACKRCSDFRPCERCYVLGTPCEEVEGGRNAHVVSRTGPLGPRPPFVLPSHMGYIPRHPTDVPLIEDEPHEPQVPYPVVFPPQAQALFLTAPAPLSAYSSSSSISSTSSRRSSASSSASSVFLPSIKTMLATVPMRVKQEGKRHEEKKPKALKFPYDVRGL